MNQNQPAQANRKIKVLVVDDDPQIRELLRTFLKPRDYTVFSAANGWEALEQVHKEPPHVMLLDVNMLGMDGLEVLKQVKEKDNKINVIMMSASEIPGMRNNAQALGAVEFLSKPFPFQSLKESIDRVKGEVKGTATL